MSNATQAAPALPLMDETYYRSRRRRQGLREDLNSFWFLLPILALFVILFLVPLVQTAYYSFTDFNGYSTNMKFVGFDNTKTVESWLLPSPPSQSGRVIIKHVKNAAVFVYNAALLSRTCHHNATLTQSFDRTLRLRFGQSHHLLQVSRVDNRLCNQIRQYTPNGGIGTHTAQIRTRFIQLFA